jgi:hypothetical protein
LDRLEQLCFDEHMGGWFGSTTSVPKKTVVYQPPPPEVFVETTTQDLIEDIETTRQKITERLQEINDMQMEAFEAQQEKMKICYDFFGKYEGAVQSSDWARLYWFGLHYVPPPNRFDPRKKTVESKPPNIPTDWKAKMRFWRPDKSYVGMDPEGPEEVRKDVKAYANKKKDWEDYVDRHWDAAFDDAFGVSEFRAFLATIPQKINVDLETAPTKDVVTTWFELHENTKYFYTKISMDHVKCEGYQFEEIMRYLEDYDKKKQINEWKQKPAIVQQLYDKVQDLQDNVEILYKLTTVHWMPNIIMYNGRPTNMYTRYDPIGRTTIERAEPPVKVSRTSKSTPQKDKAAAGGAKTTVKTKK